MAGFWMGEETQERMDLWLTQALVLLSFAAHLTLALLAGIRRRRHSGVRRSLVWLAYHVTEIGTPIALGKVFLDNTTADSEQQLLVAYREQQMFAFWAPFLLLHLGRPDNITSYALENNGLSPTQAAGLVLEIGGAIYGSYKQRFMRGDGALRAAFFIMLFFGSYKYVERAIALRRASFANIRPSYQGKRLKRFSSRGKVRKQHNDNVLLDAHGLLCVTMGAFAKYQVYCTLLDRYCCKRYGSDWKDASKVVEMEASLMYDILYTKASVIHTWGGYIIRVLSPLATATALYLFHSKDGQALESADRMVTYILLVGTLVLDVIWLLRALGSTWTYVFLFDAPNKGYVEEIKGKSIRAKFEQFELIRQLKELADSPWLRLAGRQSWYWLRRRLVSLHPSRLSLTRSGPSGHRLLPGSGVGQRNLLHECSSSPRGQLEKMISFFAGPGKKKIDIKDELLEVVCTYLVLERDKIKMVRMQEVDDYMRINNDFQKNLIALHIATDIFLLCKPASPGIKSKASATYEKQIRAISDYMMFLLAQRQHMVLPLGDEASYYKKACLDLEEIWRERGTSGSQTTREAEFANILLRISKNNDTLKIGADVALKLLHQLEPARSYGRHTIRDGYVRRLKGLFPVFTDGGQTKIKEHRERGEQSELLDYVLECILVSWVRLLTFTSVQCSEESHAKQLSCGGELLTIVWLMKHHGDLNIISKRE